MQLEKLAVICNVCFWLTIIFQLWQGARNLQAELLSTIVMLGIMALLVNVVWVFALLLSKKKDAAKNHQYVHNNQPSLWLFTTFNLLSLFAQLILLYLKFL